jgi:hypothetical protein
MCVFHFWKAKIVLILHNESFFDIQKIYNFFLKSKKYTWKLLMWHPF